MINYVKKNLFLDQHAYIAHGCNAQGVMGAGIALQVKQRYSSAYSDYVDFCTSYRRKCLGLVCASKVVNGPMIYNCITQEYYGSDGKQYANLDAIRGCFEFINRVIPPGSTLAMPKIGTGYGGLRWEAVEEILKNTVTNFNIKVYEL